ncbi:MAG: serine hydrolase [Thermoanaerobaculia bacterium]
MRMHWAAALIVVSICTTLEAQNPLAPATPLKKEVSPETVPVIPSEPHPMTAADVDAFLDGFVPLQLQREDIAGSTIAIVKDGKLLLAKGYGFADVDKKTPVSPETTLFRPGSVSKLFTWTSVMQLVEQGKLDLDRDVNAYLDFKIPEAFGKPITLKNLLTHTPGFEDQAKDLFVAPSAKSTLGDYLKTHIPRRIYPPGTTSAYSNYGAALAGYIVERVSGRPFEQYVDENIFKPLRMTHTTFAQPLPASLAPLMSKGYKTASSGAKPFENVGPEPAGSLSSSATDMSRFMIAHLQGGQLGNARILRPETVDRMHSKLFELNPAANAMAYGFYEETSHGHRIIGHAGDTELFHSNLHLMPDANFGLFISYNSAGSGATDPRSLLWDAFLNRYFPDPTVPKTLSTAKEDAKSVRGSYLGSRRSEGSFLRVASVIGELTVDSGPEGLLTVSQLKGVNGKPKHWREVEPLVFRDVDGSDYLAFKRGEGGRMEVMMSPYPVFVFQRVSFWQDRRVLVPVVVVSLVLMALTLLLWPIAALVRRHYHRPLELTSGERRTRLAVRLVVALDIAFVVGMLVIVTVATSNITLLNDHVNKWIYIAQFCGLLGAIGTLIVLMDAIQSWMTTRRSIWSRLYSGVLALACLGFLWFAIVGNLLRFTSRY